MRSRTARALTRDYDAWLAGWIPVVRADLTHKHAELRADRFRFLRGTYYLWLARVVEQTPEVLETVRVPLVGDLHVENFGTWRDGDRVRRWGVNDLDELGVGPWLLDLLRLAVSAVLAPHIALDDAEVCEVLLRAYAEARPGVAIDMENDAARHLRALVPAYGSARKFYATLAGGHAGVVPAQVAGAAAATVPGWSPTWHRREAGTGSLGHPRLVGVGPASDGREHAREAKLLGPGTHVWAAPLDPRVPSVDEALYPVVMAALRGPDTARRVEGWQIRDLAPDAVRIELAGLRPKAARLVVASMAGAAADVHAVDKSAWKSARKQARALSRKRFTRWVETLADVVQADFHAYGR